MCLFIMAQIVVLSFSLPVQGQNQQQISVHTWVYLEGSSVTTQGSESYSMPMRTTLNNSKTLPGQCFTDETGLHYFPAGQPYNKPPWNYTGPEGDLFDSYGNPSQGQAGYPTTVTDWVLVSLRSAPDGENLCRKAGLLHSDGTVEFDGLFISGELENYSSFYIVIEHRNHLIVMSDTAVNAVNGTISYDFRSHQSYIDDPFNFGAVGQKELQGFPGIFAMYAGNSDQVKTGNELPGDRTQINGNDRSNWDMHNGTVANYCCGDYNLNCDCNYNDQASMDFNNGLFSSVPEE